MIRKSSKSVGKFIEMASASCIQFNIRTKQDLSLKMAQWLILFSDWSNAERVRAISELITRCELPQIRHIMEVRGYNLQSQICFC